MCLLEHDGALGPQRHAQHADTLEHTVSNAHIARIILSAQNIFNKQYIDYNSDVRLPTDNLSFFAGRGRTMTLAWDMRF